MDVALRNEEGHLLVTATKYEEAELHLQQGWNKTEVDDSYTHSIILFWFANSLQPLCRFMQCSSSSFIASYSFSVSHFR
ncbi:hypothetical protein VNO77_40619 [Canavalia gladiata]|uniref:Uncharacterized protein n=1 Tax=Canavalia gladiata TaxID=3824 RepID=A0AAN9K052_CANGL